MTQLVRWKPATSPNIVAYKLLCSDQGPTGAFLELATISNAPVGPNYDATAGVFFYADADVPYRLYRLQTVDAFGNVYADTAAAPFPPNNDPVVAPISTVAPLDHNTGGTDRLTAVSPDGVPISGVIVRVYKKSDWDAKQFALVVGLTKTDANGRWLQPIFVEPGNTFVVQYHLPNVWGPDTVEVTI